MLKLMSRSPNVKLGPISLFSLNKVQGKIEVTIRQIGRFCQLALQH